MEKKVFESQDEFEVLQVCNMLKQNNIPYFFVFLLVIITIIVVIIRYIK